MCSASTSCFNRKLIQEIHDFLNTGKTNAFVKWFHGVFVNMLLYSALALLCILPTFPLQFCFRWEIKHCVRDITEISSGKPFTNSIKSFLWDLEIQCAALKNFFCSKYSVDYKTSLWKIINLSCCVNEFRYHIILLYHMFRYHKLLWSSKLKTYGCTVETLALPNDAASLEPYSIKVKFYLVK